MQAYDKAIELDPQYASAWNNKAYTLHELGRDEEAQKAFDKAKELDSRLGLAGNNNSLFDSGTWYDKATVLLDTGKYEEALQAFNKAIEMDADDAYTWAGKSKSLWAMGRYEEAMQAYDKAEELDSVILVYFTPYTPNYNGGSDLKIENSPECPIQVFWLRQGSNNPVFLVYVKSGETCNVKIPAGTYEEHIAAYCSTGIMKSIESGTAIRSNSEYSVEYYIKTTTMPGLLG
nr:tetratricopeptide repeat protein [uncultured Methanomethylovorans sp.]